MWYCRDLARSWAMQPMPSGAAWPRAAPTAAPRAADSHLALRSASCSQNWLSNSSAISWNSSAGSAVRWAPPGDATQAAKPKCSELWHSNAPSQAPGPRRPSSASGAGSCAPSGPETAMPTSPACRTKTLRGLSPGRSRTTPRGSHRVPKACLREVTALVNPMLERSAPRRAWASLHCPRDPGRRPRSRRAERKATVVAIRWRRRRAAAPPDAGYATAETCVHAT
mmetsp:Transcript_61729/g.194659  ORF Transcript_61729/g.194659 Transcript_61729/m.194659 type:complete len:225 (+) Transcript_61729:360-1034(+)